MKSILFLAIVVFAATKALCQFQDVIPGHQLSEEARQLRQELLAYHSGLDWFTTREEFDANYQQLAETISEGLTMPEYYRAISAFISGVRCGHTRVRVPAAFRDHVAGGGILMPFSIVIRDDKAYVDRVFGTTKIQTGDRLLEVNGE